MGNHIILLLGGLPLFYFIFLRTKKGTCQMFPFCYSKILRKECDAHFMQP